MIFNMIYQGLSLNQSEFTEGSDTKLKALTEISWTENYIQWSQQCDYELIG